MSDNHTPEQRHRNMAAIHSASTKPEIKLRHALWRLGFRYRINDKSLPGKPDVVLPKYHTVVFIHGCFWHGHIGCKSYTIPKTNTSFWVSKIARNQERDQTVWRQLLAKGWAVIIVWECQLKKVIIQETISNLVAEIVNNGKVYQQMRLERNKSREVYYSEQTARKEQERALIAELETLG